MSKKLIINSDDFGITEGVTLGTIQCHKDGVLTSATAMMNMPYVTFALEEAKKYPKLGVGIHLVLTAGRPLLSNVPSLTDENGNFLKQKNYENNKVTINPDEL